MKSRYSIILKIFGLYNLLKYSTNTDMVIDVKNGNAKINIQDDSANIFDKIIYSKPFRVFINYAYKFFILCIIGWQPVYSIVWTSIQQDGQIFMINLFQFMFLSQFILGILFYRTKYFEKTLKKIILANKLYLKIAISITLFLILSLIVISMTLFGKGYLIINYDTIYANANTIEQYIIWSLLPLEKFYCYGIFMVNLLIFSFILLTHTRKIYNLKTDIKKRIEEQNLMTIDDIISTYNNYRYQHSICVDHLNMNYAVMTIFGLFELYFIVSNYQNGIFGIMNYIELGMFILVELIYLYSIHKIRKVIDSINELIMSPKFYMKYLESINFANIEGEIYDEDDDLEKNLNKILEYNLRISIKSEETRSNVDWIKLKFTLNEPWASFNILGVNISDSSIIQQFLLLITLSWGILNLNKQFGIQI